MFDFDFTDFAVAGEIAQMDMRNPRSVTELLAEGANGSATKRYVELSRVNLLPRRGSDLERIKCSSQGACEFGRGCTVSEYNRSPHRDYNLAVF